MSASLPFPLTDRFALIISALHAAVAARIKFPPVTAGIIVFICARLRRIAAAFDRLATQIRTGTYVERPVGKRRAGGARRGVSVVMLHYHMGLPPWGRAWLHRVIPCDGGVWAGALRELLSDPAMAAVLCTVPRMRRILRPLCFMLGLEASLLNPRVPDAGLPSAPDGQAPDAASAEIDETADAAGCGDGPRPAYGATSFRAVRFPDTPGAIFCAV